MRSFDNTRNEIYMEIASIVLYNDSFIAFQLIYSFPTIPISV